MLQVLPGQTALAGTLGGVFGGIMQAYAVMGLTTTMVSDYSPCSANTHRQKTVEITRSKASIAGLKPPSTIQVCRDIFAREGYRGLNKGVNAVALRQMTTWGSRMGITRFIEATTRRVSGKQPGARLSGLEKVAASCGGGALSCWNQPLEVGQTGVTRLPRSFGSRCKKSRRPVAFPGTERQCQKRQSQYTAPTACWRSTGGSRQE